MKPKMMFDPKGKIKSGSAPLSFPFLEIYPLTAKTLREKKPNLD